MSTESKYLPTEAEKDFQQSEVLRARNDHWEHYLRCDGIPRPYVPVDVRTFMAKIRHFDDIESKGSVSWTLSIDERSVLNQNIFRKDQTRVQMRSTMDDPGGHYENDIKMCLETLKQMDIMLDNEAELDLMTNKVKYEIMKVSNPYFGNLYV